MKSIQDCFVKEVDLFMNILTFDPVFCITVKEIWRNADQILRRLVNCFSKAYTPHHLFKVWMKQRNSIKRKLIN